MSSEGSDSRIPSQRFDILDGKMYAVLAYLSIFCIIPLIVKKTMPLF